MIKLGTSDMAKAYVGSTEVSKMYLGSELVYENAPAPLPYDAEIEYLESTGTQFINTGIIPILSYSFSCYFNMSIDSDNNTSNGILFGCFTNWNSYSYTYAYNTYTGIGYNMWGNRNTKWDNSITLDTWHTLQFKSKRTYIDSNSSTASTGTGNPTYPMYLFCANHANKGVESYPLGSYGLGAPKKIAWAKIHDEDNNVILDLISVRVGQVGYMYDKVSGQLFGNAGTGSFILGPDV